MKPADVQKAESKNQISIAQLKLGCRHVLEMRRAGFTENFAIRLLELFADSYARHHAGGTNRFAPLSAKHVRLWSVDARKLRGRCERVGYGKLVRVEHGTPRRAFARHVLELHKKACLDAAHMKKLVKQYWEVAVITLEEDRGLNRIARSKMYDSPRKRWAAAGIKF